MVNSMLFIDRQTTPRDGQLIVTFTKDACLMLTIYFLAYSVCVSPEIIGVKIFLRQTNTELV